VGWAALGGSAIGALVGRVAGAPLRSTMQSIGDSLTPNSSAIVAVVEHTWVAQLQNALALEGARVVQEALSADIANQLQAGGNVLYTAAVGDIAGGVARVAQNQDGSRVSGVLAVGDGVYIGDAQFTDEQPIDAGQAAASETTTS
jgi:hypothetical protein